MKIHWCYKPKGYNGYKFEQYYINQTGHYPDNYNFIEWCCDEAKSFFEEHDDIELELVAEKYLTVSIQIRFISDLGWYGDVDRANVPIRFCPFCGYKVEFIRDEIK